VATNRRQMSVSREQVWAVLSDGHRYAEWVVGTDHIRDVDGGFPVVGSQLHYTVGRGPLRHEGHTEVLAVTVGKEIELEAHAWPLGTVRIVVRLSEGDAGCSVEIEEHPLRGVARTLHNPLLDIALKARNVETLRRLERAAAQA
jgi:uncharacterized protein YndB with AHSA1/START domain